MKKIKLRPDAEVRAEFDKMPAASRTTKREMRVSEHGSLSRLQQGMIISLNGVKYVVDMVNSCRARCVPMEKIKVVVKDKLKDKEVSFERSASAISISPNSDCPILGYQSHQPQVAQKKPATSTRRAA
jgi:hypothetical protein